MVGKRSQSIDCLVFVIHNYWCKCCYIDAVKATDYFGIMRCSGERFWNPRTWRVRVWAAVCAVPSRREAAPGTVLPLSLCELLSLSVRFHANYQTELAGTDGNWCTLGYCGYKKQRKLSSHRLEKWHRVIITVAIIATDITEEGRQKEGRLLTWFNRKLLTSSRIQMVPLTLLRHLT